MYSCNLIVAEKVEDIELNSEERNYYMERFGQCVVAFAQLEMSQTVGEGIYSLCVLTCKHMSIYSIIASFSPQYIC